nr:hypothetical protein [Deltaproteobacteria bacterium]
MPAETLDGEALRRAVILASGDARVRAMLETAEVAAAEAGVRWEASHGEVRGYAVTVALCAEDLATLDASPATRDLLERGFAVAVATAPDRSMTALGTRWNRRGRVTVATYREVARRSVEVTLDEALRRYRDALDPRAPLPDELRVDEDGGVVTVSARAPLDRAARQPIEAALASLLGPSLQVRWRAR